MSGDDSQELAALWQEILKLEGLTEENSRKLNDIQRKESSLEEQIKDNRQEIAAFRQEWQSLERRVEVLEKLLDNNNHDLFEEWFRHFLDDKCCGGW